MSTATGQQYTQSRAKWSPEEDALVIQLRGCKMKWEDISKRLHGRSPLACRLHYQNYLERRSEWDEERKNKLARLYERSKSEMWAKVAEHMGMPWRAVEAMHWQLGAEDMALRAGTIPFSKSAASANGSNGSWPSHSRVHFQPQRSMPGDFRDPQPETLPNGNSPMPTNTRAMASCQDFMFLSPQLPRTQNSAAGQNARGLYPRQNEPSPRRADMLPGIVELFSCVDPYTAPAPGPNVGFKTEVPRSTLYAAPANYPVESVGLKRRANKPADSGTKRHRIS
ncbi:DRPLA-like protein [Fusarium globosum]|uniref:DRPLA-like protein n=1 Tax=Fusarium globosum TaxID=78864 RepID=A0A8H5XVS2_9HYPO|nr:DRPLA-like protein [Fusarium globosum]